MDVLVCDQHDAVARFVAARVGVDDFHSFGHFKTLGLSRDGKLVSGAVYTDFNGVNLFAHLATDVPLTRKFLFAGFDYPFRVMGCNRITGWVEADNADAIRLDKHLGYKVEATLKGAARNGGDVLLMSMFKKDCRWLRLGERYGVQGN